MVQEYNEYKEYKHIHVIDATKIVTNMQIKRIERNVYDYEKNI
jgi:hypothetical protein